MKGKPSSMNLAILIMYESCVVEKEKLTKQHELHKRKANTFYTKSRRHTDVLKQLKRLRQYHLVIKKIYLYQTRRVMTSTTVANLLLYLSRFTCCPQMMYTYIPTMKPKERRVQMTLSQCCIIFL